MNRILNFVYNDRGWVTHKLDALMGNDIVGYLKIQYIPQQLFDEVFPTALEYSNLMEGGRRDSLSEFEDYKLQNLHERYLEFYRYHVDFPFPQFIRVEEDYLRQGIATTLYIEGGKWMRELGLSLHSSTLQCSNIVGGVWDRMIRMGLAEPLPIRECDKGKQRFVMREQTNV